MAKPIEQAMALFKKLGRYVKCANDICLHMAIDNGQVGYNMEANHVKFVCFTCSNWAAVAKSGKGISSVDLKQMGL